MDHFEIFSFIKENNLKNVEKNLTSENINIELRFNRALIYKPLTYSIDRCKDDITKFILMFAMKNNIKLNLYEALFHAVGKNNVPICLLISDYIKTKNLNDEYLDKNDIKSNLYESLLYSIAHANTTTCLLLLEYFKIENLDINLNDEYPDNSFKLNEMNILFYAVYEHSSVDIIKILIEYNVNINYVNKDGKIFLHYLLAQNNKYYNEEYKLNILKYFLE